MYSCPVSKWFTTVNMPEPSGSRERFNQWA